MGPTNLYITTLHGSLILLGDLTTAPPFRTLLLSEHSGRVKFTGCHRN